MGQGKLETKGYKSGEKKGTPVLHMTLVDRNVQIDCEHCGISDLMEFKIALSKMVNQIELQIIHEQNLAIKATGDKTNDN